MTGTSFSLSSTFTQEPAGARFLTHERIHANTLDTLLLLFRSPGFRTRIYSVTNIADSIIYACTGATSITETCGSLARMPSREDVQYHLARIDISRVNAAVSRVLQQERVMEVLGSKAADMAFDITGVPYHGQPEKEGDVRRGAAESGTTRFFMYASAYVMLYGRRFTLALKHVRADESMVDVIRYLLHEVKGAGVRIKCLFLDRGFFTAAVMSYLNSVRIPYIMAAFPGGRKGGRLSKLTRKRKDSFVVPDCEMTDSATGEKCTFRLYAVSKYRKKRYRKKKHGVQYMYYAAGNGVNIPVERMFDLYRRRFGIESSYRTMKKSRGRTSSGSAVLRLLHILVSFVIQNERVYVKWQYLSKVARGRYGKKYDTRFTYFRMRQFLRLALEMVYGAVNAILIENSRSVVGDGG
nr:transposase ISH3 [uncultured archaeon]